LCMSRYAVVYVTLCCCVCHVMLLCMSCYAVVYVMLCCCVCHVMLLLVGSNLLIDLCSDGQCTNVQGLTLD